MATRQAQTWLPAEYVPLREQIRDELRNRITDGRLPPGARIVEVVVAEEFGVSRVPLREALRLLEAEGFIEVLPRRGAVVRQLSREDVEELFQLRGALEVLACQLAAQRADPAQLRRLKQLVDQGKAAYRNKNREAIAAASTSFHSTVIEIAGNQLLATTLEPLTGRLQWLLQQYDDAKLMWEEHQHLYEAIADHDVELSASLALEHVQHSRTSTMALLFEGALPTGVGAR